MARYNDAMKTAVDVLEASFLEMRWRCLSLAADLDRIQRATGGARVLASDPRVQKLHSALAGILSDFAGQPDRAERVQMLFSDLSPPPSR